MKNSLIIFFLATISVKAQTSYRTLPDSDAAWTYCNLTSSNCIPTFALTVPASGYDTVVNSFHYSKIFALPSNSYYYPCIFNASNYVGCYRSLTSGQSYFVPRDSTQEYLLMDLSANVGDSVYNVYVYGDIYCPQLDNFIVNFAGYYTEGAINLKYIVIENNSFILRWVEIIGNMSNLLDNNSNSFSNTSLYCMSANDTTWYNLLSANGGFTMLPGQTCQMDLAVPEQKENEINIFPDPFSTEINIQNIPPGSEAVLFDAMGRKIWSEATMNEIEIVSDNFPGGIYLLQVKSKDGKIICSKKMVKQ